MSDPLALFYTMPIVVQRKTGQSAAGPILAAPDNSLLARIVAERRIVRNAAGHEVVSEARVSLPPGTPTIPPESLVTLPANFSGRIATVLAEGLHDAGLPIAFYRLDLT